MRLFFLSISFLVLQTLQAQQADTSQVWHGKQRTLRYHPEGNDFVITNGTRRFTRALYGTHTAFRAEAGDLPEFALYMPGMGGNIKFGLISNEASKWLIDANKIVARYRAGSMLYDIEDAMLGKGKLHITVLAMADEEGIVIQVQGENIPSSTKLLWVYGGATGKKFSRDGDMGPDPESSFYLKPEYCIDNRYTLSKDHFTVQYGTGEILSEEDRYENKNLPGDKIKPQKGKEQSITGVFPLTSAVSLVDAAKQNSPSSLYHSAISATPAVAGMVDISDGSKIYFSLSKTNPAKEISYTMLPVVFNSAENARQNLANRIKVNTPDPYINTIGGALSVAADAIWEEPSYLHGAVGWRVRLNGWRGAYAGDVLGWHDRARMHFRSYAASQIMTPDSGKIIADTALHLARQMETMGTSLFSSGYISRNPGGDLRPHHYDMNLVYIDELLWHFRWTGDTSFIREMWPVIKRHLAWEKRNFDSDGDGLYDAYAAIWASDALEYSGGSVTHSSAYNYRANKMAAELALLIHEDPRPYRDEASKIISAVNHVLWIAGKGWYAEYKDALGLKNIHPDAALWTIYHSIDSDLPDAFQSFQSIQYINDNIPHIPVKAKGIEEGYYTLSTSNWMPYEWSLNNVVLAELMHTSLATWEAGKNEDAFILWKSSLLESMYLGGSPGNFQQISTYDAIRGESYRDFGDPIGMTARSLVQGLFGILPDALKNILTVRPGFPAAWDHASLETPDVKFHFTRSGRTDTYIVTPSFSKSMQLRLLLKANGTAIQNITINGKQTHWKNIDSSVSAPLIEVDCVFEKEYAIEIKWSGSKPVTDLSKTYAKGSRINIALPEAQIQEVYDPQKILMQVKTSEHNLSAIAGGEPGSSTAFIKIKQGSFSWWRALSFMIKSPVEIIASVQQPKNSIQFVLRNNTDKVMNGMLVVNEGRNSFSEHVMIGPDFSSAMITVPYEHLVKGSNKVMFTGNDADTCIANIINWNIQDLPKQKNETVDMSLCLNDKVTNIFKNQYLSPRPATVTLQLPTQGIGEWTHPLLTATINDSGFRKAAVNNVFTVSENILFQTPSDTTKSNILFTSQWDNYPKQAVVPLYGNASHAYLLMAGSTNPMQTHITNGAVIIFYTDGSSDSLLLNNPETWWPIEQDYYDDGYAFKVNAAKPLRIHLKTGKIISDTNGSMKSYNGKMIDGGAATVLDLPLRITKTLKELSLQTWANDVVIGLLSVSLTR